MVLKRDIRDKYIHGDLSLWPGYEPPEECILWFDPLLNRPPKHMKEVRDRPDWFTKRTTFEERNKTLEGRE